MTEALVLGVDIGGTSSRVLLADLTGHRIGTGAAAGGNPTAYEVGEAFDAIMAALRAALGSEDPSRVKGAVIGMAGVGRLREPGVSERFERMWRALGLRCDYQVVPDTLVAFAAGSPAPHGTLLLSGTGAVACEVRDHRLRRIADGHGWLLGDLGSGFWLGREAVRAALAHLDGWVPSSPLVRQVLSHLLGTVPGPDREAVTAVVNQVRREPPPALARLAPLVCQAATDGDRVARHIISRAARHLLDAAALVRAAGDDGPLVLAGSLLVADTPLAARVRDGAARSWPHATVALARDGAAGAAWLAAACLTATDRALHARLTAGP